MSPLGGLPIPCLQPPPATTLDPRRLRRLRQGRRHRHPTWAASTSSLTPTKLSLRRHGRHTSPCPGAVCHHQVPRHSGRLPRLDVSAAPFPPSLLGDVGPSCKTNHSSVMVSVGGSPLSYHTTGP